MSVSVFPKVDVDEVYDEASMVLVIDENQKAGVYAWFLKDEQQFKVLKRL